MIHKIKIEQQWADAILAGVKKAELRYNDRNYQRGDHIRFCVIKIEKDGTKTPILSPEYNNMLYEITYVYAAPCKGLAPGWVILSIERTD